MNKARSGKGTAGGIKVPPEVLERYKAEKAAEEAKLAKMTEAERTAYLAKKRAEKARKNDLDEEEL